MKKLGTSLDIIPWVEHGFYTRHGGVSGGIFESLNCGPGSGDDLAHVKENRARVARDMRVADLVTLKQVHGKTVFTAKGPHAGDAPEADAVVTATKGIAIGVLTADCAPVLFASKNEQIIGAAHAGWRGAVGGVLEATLDSLEALGAKRAGVVAVIGPCIGPKSYEVAGDFPAPFIEHDRGSERFFTKAEKPGHLMFDLPAYVSYRLTAAGVGQVLDVGRDTLSETRSFFSYRRSQLKGEQGYGRQVSAIALR